jgi:hypothetical protein
LGFKHAGALVKGVRRYRIARFRMLAGLQLNSSSASTGKRKDTKKNRQSAEPWHDAKIPLSKLTFAMGTGFH